MNDQNYTDPVSFDVGYRCDGTGPTEYALAIHPGHLEGARVGVVRALTLYEDELESLINLITAPFMKRRRFLAADSEESVWFNLKRNKKSEQLGEYSLRVVGRGFDDILPVDREELENLVKTVNTMKAEQQARLEVLAEKEDREQRIKSRMKGKTLSQIKDEVRRVNPFMFEEEPNPQVGMVLLAAAFFVGPDIDRLASLTRYPRSFISDISCRMHDSGLWVDGEIFIEHWFDENLDWQEGGLAQDCSVADGSMVAWRAGKDDRWRYQLSGKSWLPCAT